MPYQGTKNGSVQDGYFDNFSEGFAGQIATRNDAHLIDGYPAEVQLSMGQGVVTGSAIGLTANKYNNLSAPNKVTVPVAGSVLADFEGITIRDSSDKNDANGVPIYEADDLASIMRKGRIFVDAPVAITAKDPVFMILQDTVAHGLAIGSFTNVPLGAGGIDTLDLSSIATFWKSANAGDVAIIELNIL